MSDNDTQVVHEFSKNSTEVVRASITHFKGNDYADIRVFYEAEDGEHRPTKKGLTVSLDLLGDLEAAVKALKKASET